ncbi:tetratricopeptide repeat protein [Frigoriglobus tundricola]|uniref:MalT-like TPR region domain-containing protein n=1 Tax=Frigoriglobus tundricola TaxID=2774151 RepID=A0A6M5YR54_9BACT|nr:tetratricopeptide repeat protein [Frigoriglobus tundricola]QJW96438.1 hypothetical protein FTUN_3995 [Frigoriglobus tundricola]
MTAQNETIAGQNAQIKEQNAKITVARNVATRRYESAVNAFNVLVTDVDKKLADRMGTEDLRKALLENAAKGLTALIEGGREGRYADRTLVAAYRQMGEVHQRLGDTKSALKNFALAVEQAHRVRREAEAPAAVPGDRRAADRDLGRALDKLAGILVQAGRSDDAIKAIDEAVALFTALVAEKDDAEARADLAAARARRATILMLRGDSRRAIKDCAAALTARRRSPRRSSSRAPPRTPRSACGPTPPASTRWPGSSSAPAGPSYSRAATRR